jgi:hypothetical protein
MSYPIKAQSYTFDIPGLKLNGNYVTNPTISLADCKVSKDGGVFVNTAIPTVYANRIVTISLSAFEMDADRLFIALEDPDLTWDPVDILIQTELDIEALMTVTFTSNNTSGQLSAEQINLIQGDAYDDVSWDKLSWTADADITGLPLIFTIREVNDFSIGTPILTANGTGAGTLAEITLTSSLTNAIPLTAKSKLFNFDLEVEFAANSYKTVAAGTVTVTISQTRRA